MQKRQIANTGLAVSPLGLGTVKLGRDQGVKYPSDFTIPDDRAAANLLAEARELGINLIDTAPAYGRSEERLGPLLAGQRNHWVICTKVGEEFDHGQSHFDFSARHTLASVERSLRRLQTDRLDIVLIHSDGNDLDVLHHSGALETLQMLKAQGKIRAVGMSTKTIEGGLAAARCCDLVMVTYNIQQPQEESVLDYCASSGTAVLIKKALASGHLCLQGEDPVTASMRFIFQHPATTAAIVGTINPSHLRSNVAAALQALSPA
jgi:aryl-alcohol dehydrogenase-like predicted oxidoreductase